MVWFNKRVNKAIIFIVKWFPNRESQKHVYMFLWLRCRIKMTKSYHSKKKEKSVTKIAKDIGVNPNIVDMTSLLANGHDRGVGISGNPCTSSCDHETEMWSDSPESQGIFSKTDEKPSVATECFHSGMTEVKVWHSCQDVQGIGNTTVFLLPVVKARDEKKWETMPRRKTC